MVVFLYIAVLLQIFAHTVTGKSKSVNLALETVLEFDKHNLDSDVKIIDNVQKFLSKVRNVLDANRVDHRRRMGTPYLQFTDFLRTCIETLKTYKDKDLKEFAESFDEEIRKYHYKGCKFYELLENNDARQIISRKLDEFRNHTPKKLRKTLNKIQKKLHNIKNEKVKTIAILINSLYRIDAQSKFKTFIENLEAYKTKPKNDIAIDLSKIIKNGIRALVFDHYSNLNPNVRQDVKVQVNSFINPDKKPIERNGTIVKIAPEWDPHYKKTAIDNDKQSNVEVKTDNDKKEGDTKKHKHSKQLNQEMEHDIEAEVTNKWLFEEITTAKYKKKKSHRHGKHNNTKSNKKHKKHKKKKGKLPKKKEAITTQPLNLLFRMSPGVEGRHLPEKKETTKSKTVMRIREDKPLNEIFSENIAEIFVGGETTLKNVRPSRKRKVVSSTSKDHISRFRSAKSSEMSHSEQDKKDGLSIEGWRRENFYRRSNINDLNSNNAVFKQEKQEVTKTTVETTIDPVVLKKIHNLEEELLDVKKKMREQKKEKPSTSGSSESDSDDSDDVKTTETTKMSKPTKTSAFITATTVSLPTTTSTTTVSTTINQKANTMTESSSESSSTETEEKQESTNATTTESTISEVEEKTLTTEKKSPPTPTTSFTTTKIDLPIKNSTLMELDRERKSIVIKDRPRDDNSKDSKRTLNATIHTTAEISQDTVTIRNDVFELKFNIKHDGARLEFTKIEPTSLTSKPVDTIHKSHGNDTNSKIKHSTKHSKHITAVPDIVDVISVLNSTMSNHDKLERLQSLRRKIDLLSDDDPNGISNEDPNEVKG